MTLIIKNLSKKFDDNWILKDVSLTVERGEILGLFGVVGEGKTTMMRTIAGILKPDGGTVHFDSRGYNLCFL